MAAKVSLSFGKLADTQLDNFAQGVIDAMTGNAAFPTPPITLANLQTAQTDFVSRLAAAPNGWPGRYGRKEQFAPVTT